MPIGGISWEGEEKPGDEVEKSQAEKAGQPHKKAPHKRAISYLQDKKEKVEKLKSKYMPGLIGEIFSFLFALLLAYLFIQGLGYILNTGSPLVVVESESMVHEGAWETWHEGLGLAPEDYAFGGGMGIGDIILVKGDDTDDIVVGDVIVYTKLECDRLAGGEAIIHRVVGIVDVKGGIVETSGAVSYEDGVVKTPCNSGAGDDLGYSLAEIKERFSDPQVPLFRDFETDDFRLFITKGDNNKREDQCLRAEDKCEISYPVHENMVIGRAKVDVPYLGYVKLGLVCGFNYLTGNACDSRCWWGANHPRCDALNGW